MSAGNIQIIHYPVSDMARARHFYEQSLGCTVKFADGMRWTQFNGERLGLALAAPEESVPGQVGGVVVFATEDIEATCTAIEHAGGRVLQRRDMGAHGTVATFEDTEGNLAQVLQRAPR